MSASATQDGHDKQVGKTKTVFSAGT